jgi:2-phospho-L-lactate guanylyltransferase
VSNHRVALLPVRSFRTGKQRLAERMEPETRGDVIQRMLTVAVEAALGSGVFEEIAVVSLDADVLAFVENRWPEMTKIQQSELSPGLIPALELGREHAKRHDATALTVLFADLPLLSVDDLLHLDSAAGQIAIAPDSAEAGTNALTLRTGPVDLTEFRFQFGASSFARHVAEAARFGIRPGIVRAAGLAYDLDTPADLTLLDTLDRNDELRPERTRA